MILVCPLMKEYKLIERIIRIMEVNLENIRKDAKVVTF